MKDDRVQAPAGEHPARMAGSRSAPADDPLELSGQGRDDPKMTPHRPQRGDDVEAWLKRARDAYGLSLARVDPRYTAIDRLLDRYRECSDYGLTLRTEDDEAGDP